jgi:transcriptional regulator with XRE-family HTH domain
VTARRINLLWFYRHGGLKTIALASIQLAENLRRLMGMHQVDQQQLAAYLGMTKQGIWQIVSARSMPRPSTLAKIAAAFGVEESDLFAAPDASVLAGARAFRTAPVRLDAVDALSEHEDPGDLRGLLARSRQLGAQWDREDRVLLDSASVPGATARERIGSDAGSVSEDTMGAPSSDPPSASEEKPRPRKRRAS